MGKWSRRFRAKRWRGMVRTLICVAVVVLGSCIAAQSAIIDPSAVVSVTIDSTWGGLGTAGPYHGKLTRTTSGFTREDGSPIETAPVAALLRALYERRNQPLQPADVGLTTEAIKAYAPEGQRCLGDLARYPSVLTAYRRIYFDEATMLAWLDRISTGWHTDDYPRLAVTITTADGVIKIFSESQHAFMLPLSVEVNGTKERWGDVRLARAIAALLPKGATNKGRLEGYSLVPSWAGNVCTWSSVRDAENQIGREGVTRRATQHGLSVVSYSLAGGPSNWVVGASDLAENRITAEIQSTTTAADAAFALAQQRIALIHSIPWLQRALTSEPASHIHILPGGGVFRWEVPDLLDYYKHPNAGAYLAKHANEAIRLWISGSQPHLYSEWSLFPDGTMFLSTYSAGMTGFPLGIDGYDRLTHVRDRYSDRQYVGLLVHRDGSFQTRDP